jgi:acetoacetyl-CoA synthetase
MLGPMSHDDDVAAPTVRAPDTTPVPAVPPAPEGKLLWAPGPADLEQARVTRFLRWLAAERGLAFGGYDELWRWSVDRPGEFWQSVWDFFDMPGRRGDAPPLDGGPMPDVRWFAGATVNYARVALRTAASDPDRTAVIFRSEAGDAASLTYRELAAQVARVQAGLRALGVTPGDRVAAYLPTIPAALIAMLAVTSLGAIWSSCSPDFGAASVIDRFAQIEPKVLIAVAGYRYGGKSFSRGEAVGDIVAALPCLRAVVAVDYQGTGIDRGDQAGYPAQPFGKRGEGAAEERVLPDVTTVGWDELGIRGHPGGDAGPAGAPGIEFAEVPFGHPLWVLFSSGTTGLPKPIVHGHGGVLLAHLMTISFHQDLGPGDVFFWYTTTGWMMWNYLAAGLLVGATVVLYDGSATYPGTDALWRLAADTGVTYFGTGAPYLLACAKAGLRPGSELDLTALRGVGSTGSPLPPEGFDWVYDQVKRNVVLGSFSGGTDLCTGFVGPCPLLPVRAGVISGRCLGAKVEAYDPGGKPLIGEVGELVITVPMPSMPVGFWNDPGGTRYRDSYFALYPGVWRHGDWIKVLADGGCVIYGRSDATLNRGGVRMGTSEFYRVVERFAEVADSLVVDTGQLGREGRLILYLVPAAAKPLDADAIDRIRAALRTALSPRHVPDEIHQVPGIPRTLSGKKLEVPVRKILLGTPVAEAADADALVNPEVLDYFRAQPGSGTETSGEAGREK